MDLHQYTAPTSQAQMSLQTCKCVVPMFQFPSDQQNTYLFEFLTSHQIVTPETYDHQDCSETLPYQGN